MSLKKVIIGNFSLFRRYINSGYIEGSFQRDLERNLQQYAYDFEAGKRPVLLIQASPQHGKSETIIDFMCWIMIRNPNNKLLYASVSDSLGKKMIRKVRRILSMNKVKVLFGNVLQGHNTYRSVGVGNQGYIMTATVGGTIVGETCTMAIIDDAVKGRASVKSKLNRDTTWEWFTNDLFSRLTQGGGVLSIMTRWHVDDLFSRISKSIKNAKVLNYPAILPDGSALFPELKDINFLLERKEALHPNHWQALYMGKPVVDSGNLIPVNEIRYYADKPKEFKLAFVIADTAAKTGTYNDYTVMGYFGITRTNELYLLDYYRDKVDATKLETVAVDFWNRCKLAKTFYVEDKSTGIGLIQQLKVRRLPIAAIPRGKGQDIVERILNTTPMIGKGKVYLPQELREGDIAEELVSFPDAPHDDFVSVLADAMQMLTNVERMLPVGAGIVKLSDFRN
jgi:predicted phage terminase large subunit-like protein